MNKKGILIAAVAVLVIAIIGVTYLLFTEKQANRELVQEFQLDKEDLENEYTRFAQQYDELKMTISNDSLSQLLEQEQLKTQRLLGRTPYGEKFECDGDSSSEEGIGYLAQGNDWLYQSDRFTE